jgi:hypothetical protein
MRNSYYALDSCGNGGNSIRLCVICIPYAKEGSCGSAGRSRVLHVQNTTLESQCDGKYIHTYRNAVAGSLEDGRCQNSRAMPKRPDMQTFRFLKKLSFCVTKVAAKLVVSKFMAVRGELP